MFTTLRRQQEHQNNNYDVTGVRGVRGELKSKAIETFIRSGDEAVSKAIENNFRPNHNIHSKVNWRQKLLKVFLGSSMSIKGTAEQQL